MNETRLFLLASCAPAALRQGNQSWFGRKRRLTNVERAVIDESLNVLAVLQVVAG